MDVQTRRDNSRTVEDRD